MSHEVTCVQSVDERGALTAFVVSPIHAFLILPFALQWLANPSNDMYADTVTTVILEVQSNPKIRKGTEWLHFDQLILSCLSWPAN